MLISNINNVTLRCDARASMIFLEDDANCLFDSAELDNLHQQIHRRMNEEYAKTMRRKVTQTSRRKKPP